MKLLAIVLAVLLVAGGLYAWARLHRYEVSYGGNQRYYVVVKLDRWTGRAWKMESGPSWAEIDEQRPAKAESPELRVESPE